MIKIEESHIEWTDRAVKLYLLISDIHDILCESQIEYWIEGGTLLGFVRDTGIPVGDKDCDICIPKKYETKFCCIK